MRPIIILATLHYIMGAAINPLEPLENFLWEDPLSEVVFPEENFASGNPDSFQHRYSNSNEENTDPDLEVMLRPPTGKRALAMFARWGSINGIGKNRPPIRSNLYDPEDAINTQTRGRMLGQPLRWG
nr:uncharacterized protein LOC111502133 [Leptinotarsa decemlineata]